MCGSFADPTVRDFLLAHFLVLLQALKRECLFSRAKAQELRNQLWEDYKIGDTVTTRPRWTARTASPSSPPCAASSGAAAPLSRVTGGWSACTPRPRTRQATARLREPRSLDELHPRVIRSKTETRTRFPIRREIEVHGRATACRALHGQE